jgi:hypothetical protein
MNSIPIPEPKRNEAGKIFGSFYALQRDELLAWKKNGFIRGAAYLGLCLRCDSPFFDKPIKINVENFCKRWMLSISQYFKSLKKLKEIGFLEISKTESFICLKTVETATNYRDGQSTVEVDSATVEVDSATVEVDSATVEVDSATVEVDSATVEVDNKKISESFVEEASGDASPQTLLDPLDFNQDGIYTFPDSDESESKSTSFYDDWLEDIQEIVEAESHSTTQESKEENFALEQNLGVGSNVPPVDEEIEIFDAEVIDETSATSQIEVSDKSRREPEFSRSVKKTIAAYNETGVVPKGIELWQWASEEIGSNVALYRTSGQILTHTPNDIDREFLSFLEKQITGGKAGKTANPSAWIRAMESNPSRWAELVEFIKKWQTEKFLSTDEGKEIKSEFDSAKSPFGTKYSQFNW